jgi:hypothetical protein
LRVLRAAIFSACNFLELQRCSRSVSGLSQSCYKEESESLRGVSLPDFRHLLVGVDAVLTFDKHALEISQVHEAALLEGVAVGITSMVYGGRCCYNGVPMMSHLCQGDAMIV